MEAAIFDFDRNFSCKQPQAISENIEHAEAPADKQDQRPYWCQRVLMGGWCREFEAAGQNNLSDRLRFQADQIISAVKTNHGSACEQRKFEEAANARKMEDGRVHIDR